MRRRAKGHKLSTSELEKEREGGGADWGREIEQEGDFVMLIMCYDYN